jgi:hypothetical protein
MPAIKTIRHIKSVSGNILQTMLGFDCVTALCFPEKDDIAKESHPGFCRDGNKMILAKQL